MTRVTRTALPQGETIENVFWRKRYRAEKRYDEELEKLKADRQLIDEAMGILNSTGIVLVDHHDVSRIWSNYNIDLYKLMEDKCNELRRPYFKCAKTSSSRIVVKHIGTGPARGLLTPMLLVAEPISTDKKLVRKKNSWRDVMEPVEPDFFEDINISYSQASIRHWVTSRSITVLFQGSEGASAFIRWRDQCLATPLNRMLLGIFK